MLYRKVRISGLDDKKRLYRVLYVPHNLNLSEFAQIIRETFRMNEGHLYEFRKGQICWTESREEFEEWDDSPGLPMREYNILEPGDTYRFIYDYGDDWEFEIRIYKAEKEFDSDLPAIVLDGKGRGIWEDNHGGYWALLNGEMPMDLSEDDEERDFYMPWNLELEKAGNTFDTIDPEEETDYLSAVVSRDETDDDSGSIWKEFNSLYDRADDISWLSEGESSSLWIRAFEEFKRICENLKAENRLPDTLEELEDQDPAFDGYGFAEDLVDALLDENRYEELLRITDEFAQLFDNDPETMNELIRGKAEALYGLGRSDEMLAYTKQVYEENPANYEAARLLLDAYRYNRKKKDGKQFMEAVLKKEPEINDDNYPFYYAAMEFAEYAGMKALAKKLRKTIDAENEKDEQELEEELSLFGEEDEDFDFLIRHLHMTVTKYKLDPTDDHFTDVVTALGLLAAWDEMIWFAGDSGGSHNGRVQMRMVKDQDTQKNYLGLFSTNDRRLQDGVTLYKGSAKKLLKMAAEEEEIGGVILDAYPDDDGIIMIEKPLIIHLLELAHRLHDSYDEDDEQSTDWMDDDDSLPF